MSKVKKGKVLRCKNCKHKIDFNKPRDIYIHSRNPYVMHSLGFKPERYTKEVLIPCFCGCKKPEIEHELEK